MLIDEKFKDATPESTVERIQTILKQNDISVNEEWHESGVINCYSLRVSVDGTSFGSNGKGITKELAKASAYGELMERMQAGYLSRRFYRDNALEYNDSIRLSFDAFINRCEKPIKDILKGVSALLHFNCDENKVAQKCIEAENSSDDCITLLPFYDAMEHDITYFPQRIIPSLYTTNGLAAGNSFEEACVQGFSELFERRNLLRCIFGSLTPPNIPDSYLKNYPRSYQIIQDIRANGLELQIKDCSLGEDFPLIAAVAIDKTVHSYHVHMGAHPVFEIALERCLTEMFQGRTLTNVAEIDEISVRSQNHSSSADLFRLLTRGSGKYSASFFSGEPSFSFVPFPDRSAYTNKELLAQIISSLKGQGYHLLVRSTAHLGFPSVRLIIPGYSEAFPTNLISNAPTAKMLEKYKLAPYVINSMKPEEQDEYRSFLYNQVKEYGNTALDIGVLTGRDITGYSKTENKMLAQLLFAKLDWKKDKAKAISIARAALPLSHGYVNNYLSCVCKTFEYLLNGFSVDDALKDLSVFYEEKVITDVKAGYELLDTPFDCLMLQCAANECEMCAYKHSCTKNTTEALIAKIKAAAINYDNSSDFSKLSEIFSEMQ